MPGGHYIVFKNLRPPVCIDNAGSSPLRGLKARKTFALGEGDLKDQKGFKVQKEEIAENLTDDGRL